MNQSAEARKEFVERYFYPRQWLLLGLSLTSFTMFFLGLTMGVGPMLNPFSLRPENVYESALRELVSYFPGVVVIAIVFTAIMFGVWVISSFLFVLTLFNHSYLQRMKVISERRNRSKRG